MAIGDDALAAGYPLVPNNGEEGKVKWGAREINRTRDFVAQVKAGLAAIWGINRGGTGATTAAQARTNLGMGPLATLSVVPLNNGGTGLIAGSNIQLLKALGVGFTSLQEIQIGFPAGQNNPGQTVPVGEWYMPYPWGNVGALGNPVDIVKYRNLVNPTIPTGFTVDYLVTATALRIRAFRTQTIQTPPMAVTRILTLIGVDENGLN